jgi:hypothetical protein
MMAASRCALWIAVAGLIPLSARAQSAAPTARASAPAQTAKGNVASRVSRPTSTRHQALLAPKAANIWRPKPVPMARNAGPSIDHPSGLVSNGTIRAPKVPGPAHPLPAAGLVPSTIRRRAPNLVSLSGASLSARSKGTVALDGGSVRRRRSDR